MLVTGKRWGRSKGRNRRLQSHFRGGTNRVSARLSPGLSTGIAWLWARCGAGRLCLALTGGAGCLQGRHTEVAK